jgi:hypothetical protein
MFGIRLTRLSERFLLIDYAKAWITQHKLQVITDALEQARDVAVEEAGLMSSSESHMMAILLRRSTEVARGEVLAATKPEVFRKTILDFIVIVVYKWAVRLRWG